MRRFLVNLLLLLLLLNPVFAQQVIKGKILTRNTREPVPYANMGIRNSNVGTISDADGSFTIDIPESLYNDTLVFSALGFGERAIPVKYFRQEKEYTIYLNGRIKLLKPVVITNSKAKDQFFELGSRRFNGGVYEPDTTYAGRSVALLIDQDESYFKKGLTFPVFVEKARLRIFRNNLKSFKFRIRLNKVDNMTGHPGEDLLEESVIVESTMKNGWLSFDLSQLNIQATGPFFITFEQILDQHDRAAIAQGYRDFITRHPERLKIDTIEIEGKKEVRKKLVRGGIDLPGTFIGISSLQSAASRYTCFVRPTSYGEWEKVRGIVAATVTVSRQPDAKAEAIAPCNDVACRAEKLCTDFLDETGMNGMQVCVSKGDKIKWSANLGYADVENRVPVTDVTRFRINSVSKSMTSAALIKLMAEHKLDPDAPVQQYVPGFPIKKYAITTRQLAGHLAGFRDYKEDDPGDYIRTEHFDNATQALRIFENDTLLFEPGARFHYSTFGWNLIGAIIEGISGESYLEYMRKNIWQPLQLTNTCGDDIRSAIPNSSKFYDATGQENDLGDMSYKYSGGGLLSTAGDLVKFGNELLHGAYINPTLKKILFETQYTSDKQPTGYGIGWYTGKDKNGHRIWYHGGDSFSGSSYIIIYPDDDMVIAFLGNGQEGANFDVQKIGELFYNQ